ncbi:kinesin-like protein KIF20B [Microplitis demolitor]|uniref:kinesin-like protein KIF20B n=1 Tax=Microplitis demolitor TaxID=69319 RepID=UPI0004CD6793|nr:kinesin-like protein KIF20B [Microplitis demolitor]
MNETNPDDLEMDKTLDPIRPSSLMTGEMSYIFGRDPSILSFGQRPGPSVEAKKNLYSVYEVEETQSETQASLDVSSAQTIKVYLRLKPFSKKPKLTPEQEDAYRITSSTSLLTKLPSQDNHTMSMRSSSIDLVCRKYTFTETFGPDTSQADFFNRVLQPQMPEFLEGHNATIMTYGTTNSGKSYTLQGTASEPGLIPRSLEYLFSHIHATEIPNYKPVNHSEVIKLSSLEKQIELENKSKLVAYGASDRNQYIDAFKKMQQVLKNEAGELNSNGLSNNPCAVWISFAEIYNETIYDLLSNDSSQRRPALKLATDNHGATFIKGLKSIFVTSSCEAYQILMAGQYNLKVAATALNAHSSRSHCIFSIKLLRNLLNNDPKSVEMSTFTFCDLAGSERLKKTLNQGDRLKEAKNINTSLMVLGRCLKSIFDVQTVKQQRSDLIGPFRESKLTRLFQTALTGKEPIALVVNVNPSPNLYIETQNVLNFAAMAKKIVIQPKMKKRRKSKTRFSHLVLQSTDTATDWDEPATECDLESIVEQSTEEECAYVAAEDYEILVEENRNLRKEIEKMKSSAFKRDLETRDEISKYYSAVIKRMEEDHQSRLNNVKDEHRTLYEWELETLETYYKNQLAAAKTRKRKRSEQDDDDEDDDSDADVTRDEMEIQIKQLNQKVDSLKEKLKKTIKEKDEALVERNKAIYQQSLDAEQLKVSMNLVATLENSCIEDKSEAYVNQLKQELHHCKQKKKSYENLLDQAKKDFIELRNEIDGKECRINKLEIELAHKDEELADVNSVLENTEEVLAQKEDLIQERGKEIKALTQQLEELEYKYDELKKLYKESTKETVLEIKERTSDARDMIEELEEKVASLEKENNLVSEKLSRKIFEVQELKNNLREIQINYDELKEQRVKFDTDEERDDNKEVRDGGCQTSPPTSTQSNQTSFSESVQNKSLQTSMTFADDKLDGKENQLEELREKYSKLKAKYEEEQERVMKLNEELEAHNEENERMKAARDYYKEDLYNINEELTETKKTISNIKSELDEKERVKAELELKLEKFEQLVANLEDENKKLKELKESCEDDLNKKNEELAQVKDKFDSVKNGLEQKELQLDSVEKKLEINREVEVKLKELNKQMEKVVGENEKLKELKEICEGDLSKKSEELAEAKDKINFIKKDLEDKETQLDSLEKELETKQKMEIEFEELKQQIEKLSDENKKLEELKETCENEMRKVKDELSEARRQADGIRSELEDKESQLESIEKKRELEGKLDIKLIEIKQKVDELSSENEELKKSKEVYETDLNCCREKHLPRIAELEKAAEEAEEVAKNLKSQISELEVLRQELEESKKSFENKIEELEKTVREKDKEIYDLQKEIKGSIKLGATDDLEKELKQMIKERDEAKEKLSELDKLNKKLQTKNNNYDRDIEEMKATVNYYKRELEILKDCEDRYRKTIDEKERELESFKKNRDEMVNKTENLIKKLQEDLEKEKREVKKFQDIFLVKGHTPRDKGDEFRAPSSDRAQLKLRENKPPKDTKEETSEDESVTERRGRRARKVLEPTSPNQNIPIVEISETESTRSTRKTTAKTSCPSTGKRQTRGRRLYTPIEDGVIVIPTTPEPLPSPASSTRSLRTRRNK